MPYCNWCQLESDSIGSCVWCKRPFDDKTSVFNKRADYHFLKTEEDVSPTPYYAIFGVICIVALATLGYFTLRPKPVVNNNTNADTGWTIQPGQSQVQQGSAVALTNYPQNAMNGSADMARRSNSYSAAGPGSTQQLWSDGKPDSFANDGTRRFTSTGRISGYQYLIFDNPGADLTSSNSANLTIFVQSVKFSLVQDHKGVTHLVGDVVVVNDMLSPLTDGKLWLQVAGMKYDLKPYDGSVNAPKWLGLIGIGSKQSGSVHVMAMGFKPWGPLAGTKHIGLDAKVASVPVRAEAEIKDKAPAQAAS